MAQVGAAGAVNAEAALLDPVIADLEARSCTP